MVELWTCRFQVQCQTYIRESRVVQLKNLWLTCESCFLSFLDCKVLRSLRKGLNFWLPLLMARGVFKYLNFVSFYLLHSAINWQTWIPDDQVRPQTEEEEELYKLLSEVTQKPASLLRSKWREPSLTIHNIEISGPRSKTNLWYIHDRSLIQ